MKRYEIPDHVLRASLQDEVVLLNTSSETYHLLNTTGQFLIQAFESGSDFEESVRSLAAAFGQPLEAVREEAAEFVKQMTDRGLIEAVED